MRNKLTNLLVLAAVGFGAWLGITVAQSQTNTNSGSIYLSKEQMDKLTIKYDPGTNFLTLSNRQSVQIYNCVVIRNVTDAEWAALTNHYPCSTQTYVFYGKGCPTSKICHAAKQPIKEKRQNE